MISKVISGGQTGSDIAGLRAAKEFGIETGGWMPRGFKTEDGNRPEYAELYGMKATGNSDYGVRTRRNIRESGATIIFGDMRSRGSRLTRKECDVQVRERFNVPTPTAVDPSDAAEWIQWIGCNCLNVAGNRESVSPGIEAWVFEYLCELFELLGHTRNK